MLRLQVMLQGAASDSEKYKDFMQTSTIEEVEIVDADYHSTLCNACQSVCHDHCNLNEISDAGQILYHSLVCLATSHMLCRNQHAKSRREGTQLDAVSFAV